MRVRQVAGFVKTLLQQHLIVSRAYFFCFFCLSYMDTINVSLFPFLDRLKTLNIAIQQAESCPKKNCCYLNLLFYVPNIAKFAQA